MKFSKSLTVILFFISFQSSFAQTTANDNVPEWNDYFRYGVNPGYYPNWGDKDTILANIAAGNPNVGVEGAGVTAFRATLPEWFINTFGINVRNFAFEHYETLGMSNHTVFLEGPDEFHFDPTEYCEGEHSELFANMYLDIWDDGQNGTPINDENYYALYVYNVVSNYKDYVLYWEIWNEPDFTGSFGPTLAPGEAGSWWTEDPDPCDLAIKAPIEYYVRMLRISYEVIKSIDPDSYVTAGGLGFPSFLHAILRNTDNPVDGSVTPEYPLKGGAYFDVMSYHLYPHLSGCYRIGWNNDIFDFDYQRNSDAAAECIVDTKYDFQDVFDEFGYDGQTYPEKRWIITEINVPRVSTDPSNPNNYGNDEIQRNWVIKACVTAQMNDIDQIYLYQLGETENEENAGFEFNMMGLYKNLNASTPYNQIYTDEGIAYKTLSETLSGWRYDALQTDAMNLPPTIKGAAFRNDNGEYRYVLWAITDKDQTEEVSATYSFPEAFNIESLEKTNWSSSIDGNSSNIGSNGILLTGEPVFLKPTLGCALTNAPSIIGSNSLVLCEGDEITLTLNNNYENYLWSTGSDATTITVSDGGVYVVTVTDELGCTGASSVQVNAIPEIQIDIEGISTLCNGSSTNLDAGSGFETYQWSNQTSNQILNTATPGIYAVTVTDVNGCTGESAVEVTQSTQLETFEVIDLCYGEEYNGIAQFTNQSFVDNFTSVTGCDSIHTMDLIINPDITVNAATEQDCFGTGSIEVQASGGAGNYNYLWNVGQNTATLNNASEGFYSVIVTDETGCTTEEEFYLETIPAVEIQADVTNILCAGDSFGSIDITPIGGTPPYTYYWSNGWTTEDIQNLIAFVYTLEITDANNCIFNFTIEVTELDALLPNINSTPATSGDNGVASSSPLGGTPPYAYQWSTGAQTPLIIGLTPDTYYLTVTDANGCESFGEVIISTSTSNEIVEDLIDLNIYPNPNDGNFFVDFELSTAQEIEINLQNYLGQSVWTKEFYQKMILEQISVENLAAGIYFLSIETEKGSVVRKVVVE